MATPALSGPSSQMDTMPPDFASQFQSDCSIAETQRDTIMADASTAAPPPFNVDAEQQSDNGDDTGEGNTNGSPGSTQNQIDIFQGVPSLFGGDDNGDGIPETPPFSQLNGVGTEMIELSSSSSTSSPSSSPQPPPEYAQIQHNANLLPPYPFTDPVLDPRLGTQMPESPRLSSREYYGSVEDNEHSASPEPEPFSRRTRHQCRSETPDSDGERREYEFRERAGGIITTHLDWDESGNYDPAEEGRKGRGDKGETAKKRRSGQLGVDGNGERRPKRPKAFSLSRARLTGASFLYTISLESEAGKALLEKYQGQDNWPDEDLNVLSDKHVAEALRHEEELDDGGELGRRKMLRPRKRFLRYNSVDVEQLPPIPDPLGLESDLRNHPAARGCVKCRQAGKKCSLRETGSTWPCVDCLQAHGDDDVVQCELIQPPTKKMTCENCIEADQGCSYDDADTDHVCACQQCQDVGLCCVAAPDMLSLPQRITYTPPPGVKYTPFRPFVACTACRQAKKSCSLKSKADDPPCRTCAKAKIPCTFEKLVPTNAGKQKAIDDPIETMDLTSTFTPSRRDSGFAPMPLPSPPRQQPKPRPTSSPTTTTTTAPKTKQTTIRRYFHQPPPQPKPTNRIRHINPTSTLTSSPPTSYTPTPHAPASYHLLPPPSAANPPITDSSNRPGIYRDILTPYPHPLVFHTRRGSPPHSCAFCTDPSFALLGLAWMKPAVVQWADGRGYTEIGGGHREAGVRAAEMCAACVAARVDIVSCEEHALEPVGAPGEDVDERAAGMLARLGERRADRGDVWCSVCPSAAVWRCGCGLGLCGECGVGVEGAGLQAWLEGRLATEGGVVACRADAGFLLERGLLMENVCWEMGVGE